MQDEWLSKTITGLTYAAWASFALLHGVLLLGMEVLPACVQFPLLGIDLLALTWLMFRYNRRLAQWRSVGLMWLVYTLARLGCVALHATSLPFISTNGADWALMLAVEAMLAGWFSILALAIRRDTSLAYLILFFVLSGPVMGAVILQAGGVLNWLQNPGADDPNVYFSLTEPIIMSLSCMTVLGFLAFVPHLGWLLIREIRGY